MDEINNLNEPYLNTERKNFFREDYKTGNDLKESDRETSKYVLWILQILSWIFFFSIYNIINF